MEWNLESAALIKLLDDDIVDIDIDCDRKIWCTCEDCDYNRTMAQTVTVTFKDGNNVTCIITGTLSRILDESKTMRFFTNNTENFARMTRHEFCTFFKRLEERKLSDREIWEIYRSLI